MSEKEIKYVVLKVSDIVNAGAGTAVKDVCSMINRKRKAKGKGPIEDNRYILCNQDEPYAEKVWQTILEGERTKETERQERGK